MSTDRLVFRLHAIQRMFERQISVEDVRHVLSSGETIIVTVYEPDPAQWEADFRRRKP